MAVEVDFKGTKRLHEDAHGVFVKDGHLHVMTTQYSSNALTVAMYAPGFWSNAVIVPEEAGKYAK